MVGSRMAPRVREAQRGPFPGGGSVKITVTVAEAPDFRVTLLPRVDIVTIPCACGFGAGPGFAPPLAPLRGLTLPCGGIAGAILDLAALLF